MLAEITLKFRFLIILTGYIALSLIILWPLPARLTTHIPNNLYTSSEHTFEWGDHLQMLAGIKEHKQNLLSLIEGNKIYDKEFCIDKTGDCKADFLFILKRILLSPYWPQTIFFILFPNDVLAYNLATIAALVLNGLWGYLLPSYFIHKLTANKISGFYKEAIAFTASLFTLTAPLIIHQMLVGHKNGFIFWVLISCMLAFEKWIDTKKSKFALLCAFILIFLAIGEQYLMLLGFGYIVSRTIFIEITQLKLKIFKNKADIARWLKSHVWILITLLITFKLNTSGKLENIAGSNMASGRSLEEIRLYSPGLENILTRHILSHELNLYLGAGIFILAATLIFALIKIFSQKAKHDDSVNLVIYMGSIFIVILLLSLGLNTPVYEWMYANLPILKFGRTPVRFAFILFPVFTVLFTVLSVWVVNRWQRPGQYYLVFAFIVIAASYIDITPLSLTTVPRPLPETRHTDKVLMLPYTQPDNFFGSIYEYYISQKNFITLNGYTPFISNSQQQFFDKYAQILNRGDIDSEEINKLSKTYNINTIIILKSYYGRTGFGLDPQDTLISNIDKIELELTKSDFYPAAENKTAVIWKSKL